ncbi:MAG TPA: DUF6567 family protein [Cytophagales bacterium]|nr:DUF6567 family protein [Cytophagales bacterium]
MKQLTIISLIAVLFTSCLGVHHGTFQSSVALSENNYKIIKRNVSGQASTTIVLGFGGLGKDALVARAKENLIKEHSVTGTQQLANVSVDWKIVTTPVYFVVFTRTCTVTADIIEFTK